MFLLTRSQQIDESKENVSSKNFETFNKEVIILEDSSITNQKGSMRKSIENTVKNLLYFFVLILFFNYYC